MAKRRLSRNQDEPQGFLPRLIRRWGFAAPISNLQNFLRRIPVCRLVLIHFQGRFGFPIVKRILVGGQIGLGARHRNIEVGREVQNRGARPL